MDKDLQAFADAVAAKDKAKVKALGTAIVQAHPEIEGTYGAHSLGTLCQMVSELRAAWDDRRWYVEAWIQHAHGPQSITGTARVGG